MIRNESRRKASREEIEQENVRRRWDLFSDESRSKMLAENFRSHYAVAEDVKANRLALSRVGGKNQYIQTGGGNLRLKTVRSVHRGYEYENQVIDPSSKRPVALSRFNSKGQLVWTAVDFDNQEAMERLFGLAIEHPFDRDIPRSENMAASESNPGSYRGSSPQSSGARKPSGGPPPDSALAPDQRTSNKNKVIGELTKARDKFLFGEDAADENTAAVASHTGGWLVGPEKWGRVMRGVDQAAGGRAVNQEALNAIVKEDAVSELAARREASKLNIAYTGGTVEDVRGAAARYQGDLDNHNKKTVA